MAATNNVGWRYVEYMKVGDEYAVKDLGTTIGAVWNASGAIIGSQSLPDIGRRFVCLAPGNGTGTVEDLQLNLNATLGPISGTVAVSNFPASQAVTGTFFQATQPVSGTVNVGTLPSITIANTSFDVGNFPATQTVAGTVDIGTLPSITIANTSFDVGNFPATQTVAGTVDIGTLPSITIANTSFDVGNFPATQTVAGTVDIGTLPSITIANTSFDVGNLVPLPSANIRTASELIVGNWFKVETLGNTIGAVWNGCGALIGGESSPPIGRVFKCLSNGNGTGTVSTVIYNENVVVSSLPSITIANTSFDVGNFPTSVDVSTLPSITIANTSFDVGNFPATQTVSGTVDIGTLPSITIANTSFDVGNFPATQTVAGTVDIGTLPSITIANTSFDVSNFPAFPAVQGVSNVLADSLFVKTDPTAPLEVNIQSSSIGFQVANVLANSLFVQNDATTPLIIKVPTIDCVSLNTIGLVSQVISTSQNTIRSISLSHVGSGNNFCYLKLYALASATDTNIPIANIGVKSGDTIVIPCDLFVGANICCRATDDFSITSTTPPAGTITASFFIYIS